MLASGQGGYINPIGRPSGSGLPAVPTRAADRWCLPSIAMRATTSRGARVHEHPHDQAGHGSHSEGNSPPHVSTPSVWHAFYARSLIGMSAADSGM